MAFGAGLIVGGELEVEKTQVGWAAVEYLAVALPPAGGRRVQA